MFRTCLLDELLCPLILLMSNFLCHLLSLCYKWETTTCYRKSTVVRWTYLHMKDCHLLAEWPWVISLKTKINIIFLITGIININESSLCRIRLPLLKLPVIFGLLAYIYVWLSIRCLAGCPTDITNPIATQLSLLLNILQFIKVKVTPTKPVVQTENLGVTFNSLLWT